MTAQASACEYRMVLIQEWGCNPLASSCFTSGECHPVYGEFGRQYYPAIHGNAVRDVSFVLFKSGKPLAFVPCNILSGALGWFGLPLRPVFAAGLTEADLAITGSEVIRALDDLGRAHSACLVRLRDDGLGQSLTPLGRACFNLAASVDVKLHGLCAGIRSKDDLWRTMRKSFRSLVNWGRRETDLVRVNGSNPDRGLFDRYRAFHHQIAGRITRSDKSWDVMFDWIAAGHGELVLTYLKDGALVAGTMIVDGKEIAYYASGVYDRTRFDRPMGHWPLFSAIMQSMERGIKAFDLGELPQRHQADPKEYAIGYFKRGFAQEIAPHFVWSWSPTRKSSHDAP